MARASGVAAGRDPGATEGRPPARADLHLHSDLSDGLFPPREVMRRAHGAGLLAAALTDHDTLAGLSEARVEALRLGFDFLPGCEISVAWEGFDLHILAYGVEAGSPLGAELERMEAHRLERLRAMLARLARLGAPVSEQAVLDGARGCRAVGRQHLSRALVAGGWVSSREEAFGRFIGASAPAYVPKETEPLALIL
ncbi:MAG: PHP domain-containing protein, partial [Candidatus Eisenbacteria bacterium]|nr:PHP domain-containing protein [Candidatus Eisenbacteria bacterium]